MIKEKFDTNNTIGGKNEKLKEPKIELPFRSLYFSPQFLSNASIASIKINRQEMKFRKGKKLLYTKMILKHNSSTDQQFKFSTFFSLPRAPKSNNKAAGDMLCIPPTWDRKPMHSFIAKVVVETKVPSFTLTLWRIVWTSHKHTHLRCYSYVLNPIPTPFPTQANLFHLNKHVEECL